jgi:hypothetical protein
VNAILPCAHLHGHLVSPEAQRFASTLHDNRWTHSTKDIGFPLLSWVEIILEYIVLVWKMRLASRTHALVPIVTCEAGFNGAFIAEYVTARPSQ